MPYLRPNREQGNAARRRGFTAAGASAVAASVLSLLVTTIVVVSTWAPAIAAEGDQLVHIRGKIASVNGTYIEVDSKDGGRQQFQITDQSTVLRLSPGSFTDVDFGVYVGSVSEKMDGRYSPIYRDSLSWLHQGLEIRIIDESLRGIALGHMSWDLTPVSVMTHGWVDDLEVRVISIKYGPTEAEETDVEIGRELTILKMALGDRALLQPGAGVFAGVSPAQGGGYTAAFVMVGENGIIPQL